MSQKSPLRSSRKSIKFDRVAAKDYNRHKLVFSCETCSHFAPLAERCTLEFNSIPHRQKEQERLFNLTGHMALCRFHEID